MEEIKNEDNDRENKKPEETEKQNEEIKEFGQTVLHMNRKNTAIYLLSVIGEIEGHECLPSTSKTTKYELSLIHI